MRIGTFRPDLLCLFLLLGSVEAAAFQRGVVNAVSVTPKAAQTGTTISAAVTGINPCGAVFIDWGDGTAITHAIIDLPTTHTHAYAAAGNYTVRARGMGNCDGDVTASVRIDGPADPAAGPALTGFSLASPADRGAPVRMRMEGRGTCNVSVTYGDGNTQEFSVQLPHSFTHVYSVTGGYNVTAAARPPCEGGRHTVRLEVAGEALATSRISGLTVRPDAVPTRGAATIMVAGTGSCSYVLDYGDGNSERRTAVLPERVRHVFPAGGTFVVTARAEAPCQGRVQDTLALTRPTGSVDGLIVSPIRARVRSRITVTVEGQGTCGVTVDYGDGNEQTFRGALPVRMFHNYTRPGRYEVFAWAEAPCQGDASGNVRIDR